MGGGGGGLNFPVPVSCTHGSHPFYMIMIPTGWGGGGGGKGGLNFPVPVSCTHGFHPFYMIMIPTGWGGGGGGKEALTSRFSYLVLSVLTPSI